MDNSKKIRDNPIFIANVYIYDETKTRNLRADYFIYIWDNTYRCKYCLLCYIYTHRQNEYECTNFNYF